MNVVVYAEMASSPLPLFRIYFNVSERIDYTCACAKSKEGVSFCREVDFLIFEVEKNISKVVFQNSEVNAFPASSRFEWGIFLVPLQCHDKVHHVGFLFVVNLLFIAYLCQVKRIARISE